MPTTWPRAILHVDLDAFYPSVHQRDDASLRGRPVAVAGSSRRAVVMGASYEARTFGPPPAIPPHGALELCPDLVIVRPAAGLYREASRNVHSILRRFAAPERIESVALDEAYLDVTARTRHGTTTPEDIARQVKFMIRNEVHLTASVGVAVGRVVAKVASASRKPDGMVVVPPGTEAEFMAAMPIGVLPGIGPKTEERLRLMGMRRVGDLA